MDQACCVPNDEIFVKNTAFTGGQDAQKNSVIQQKDIDGAAKGLITSGQEQTLAALREQLRSNERVVGEAQCQPQINADQKAGALAKKATVQVAVTCSETVYDYDAARQSVTQDLQNMALTTPTLGAAYALAGQVAVTRVSPAPGAGSAMLFHAQGRWVYQFTETVLRDLTTHIAGLSQDAARTLLLRQPGILGVQFSASGSLPVNASEIQLVVQTPPPASA